VIFGLLALPTTIMFVNFPGDVRVV
jgi:hypothetical protein